MLVASLATPWYRRGLCICAFDFEVKKVVKENKKENRMSSDVLSFPRFPWDIVFSCFHSSIRKSFAKMDLDDSGSIDADELGLILKSFGEAVPPSRVQALIREVRKLTKRDVKRCQNAIAFESRTIGARKRENKLNTLLSCKSLECTLCLLFVSRDHRALFLWYTDFWFLDGVHCKICTRRGKQSMHEASDEKST